MFHDCHDGRADCINYDGGYNCSCYPEWSGGLNNGTNCTGKDFFFSYIYSCILLYTFQSVTLYCCRIETIKVKPASLHADQ